MGAVLKLLILEDSALDAELVVEEVTEAGFDPVWTRVETADDFRAALLNKPDIVIADYRLPQFDAMAALSMAVELAPEVPVIVVSGTMSEETCVQCLRHGAVDYLLKDRLTRLGPAVQHALAGRELAVARLRAEHEARDAASVLQHVVDGAPTLIYLADDQDRLQLVNSEFERLCGVDRDRLIGRRVADVAIGGAANGLAQRDARCLALQSVQEAEEVFGTGDRQRTYVSIRYPLSLAGGVHAVAAVYTDISRQKQTESALREAQKHLIRQAEDLSSANVELHKLDVLRSQFIATVSHELRTPLTSILAYTELLLTDGDSLPPENLHMVTVINRNGRRLLGLIEDLLDIVRIDGGALHMDRAEVDIVDLIEHCCAAVRPSLRTTGLTIGCDLHSGLPSIYADRGQLEQVFLNLLSNAVKFSPDGGSVTITAWPTDDGKDVSLAISDTGVGVPFDEQAHLFTRFFRSSIAEWRAIGGTGLGLAICKSIVEGHQGHIHLVSAPDVGTTVTVTLPRYAAVAPAAVPAHR